MVKELLFSVWLIPANPSYDVIKQQIEHLAITNKAPKFLPHMTLLSGASNNIERTKQQFREFFTQQHAITLQSESIQHSSYLYKSLFIQLNTTKELTELKQAVTNRLDAKSDYQLNPHASLMYKQIPEQQKAKLATHIWNDIKDNIHTITFEKAILMSDTQEVSEAAVSQWQILETVILKSKEQ